MLKDLYEMLTYARPAGSRAERAFRKRFLLPLPGAITDPWGNIHVIVGPAPVVLWSAHTDTVHRASGRQHPVIRGSFFEAPKGANCLGADDTVGCYLLRELILAGIPGEYVFHYGEERGGIGSSALAKHRPDWAKSFLCAIALDRQGTGDIVTHQFGGRTASDRFAISLADALSTAGLRGYAPAPGIYTDTAEYADLIPECTNLSVGYYHQHTSAETVDCGHVLKLRQALIDLSWEEITIAREPGDDDFRWGGSWPGIGPDDDWRFLSDAEREEERIRDRDRPEPGHLCPDCGHYTLPSDPCECEDLRRGRILRKHPWSVTL